MLKGMDFQDRKISKKGRNEWLILRYNLMVQELGRPIRNLYIKINSLYIHKMYAQITDCKNEIPRMPG